MASFSALTLQVLQLYMTRVDLLCPFTLVIEDSGIMSIASSAQSFDELGKVRGGKVLALVC